MSYTHMWTVKFGQVDQAGILYYPELFDSFHHGVEAFLDSVGFPLHELVVGEEIGMPIVHAEADYIAPIRFGTTVGIEITVSMGDSSLTFFGSGHVDDEEVFSVTEKHATIDMTSFESIPVPKNLRKTLEPYERE